MKRYLILFSITLLAGIILDSCQPENVEPSANDPRSKIVKLWDCEETTASLGTQLYQVNITIDPNYSDRVLLENFFGMTFNKEVYARMDGLKLTIPTQTVSVAQNDTWIFVGTGTIASNYKTINFSYTADDGNGPKQVTAVYSSSQ